MKKISTIFSVILLLAVFTGCGKDNYDEPESTLTGKITYNGEAVNVRGTDERVRLQLYQDGYAKHDPIEVFVGQEGTFSAKLFNGEYKMVTRNNNGPWVNSRDTTIITVKGSTVMEFKVTPYFTISNSEITLSGNTMNTSFSIAQIVSTAEIEKVLLLLNSTSFVDDGYNIQAKEFIGDQVKMGQGSYSLELNEKATQARALFGRVCVRTRGVDQGIYSPVVRLR